ncbi:histidine phosphatase family protein [Roseinatronobacter alkalisoli]|uniref:Histidine phosphatase family protein n=1 Tax=Roseinatronobacter alkalisoli TaxID=3028235 RepID=A0ABT5T9J3_9RHOB|nr:histidine phosphatase family protein [Roseinatronobacter sp. HJB301]MDD7971789.1 histidine phosphatase family protein [Roseinatronobacter sp. HJB301]
MAMILLRHTRPDMAPGICYGRSDPDLAPCFADAAQTLVDTLPDVLRVVSSPLMRCLRLARHVADARAIPLSVDPRLSEMDFGTWEGQPWNDIPRAQLDAWAGDVLHARPHGGESVAALRVRALAALRDHAAPATLVVTHHGVIKCARSLIMGDGAWQSDLPFGQWITFSAQVFTDAT